MQVDDANAGTPPSEADSNSSPALEAEIMDVLSIGEAAEPAPSEPNPQAASPAAAEAGAAVPSAAAAPETPPAAPTEATPQPAAAEPPAGTPPASSATPTAAPAPAAPTPAAPQPQPLDERALREASQAAQIEALQRTIQELRASPQPGSPPAAAPSSGEPAAEQPFRYTLTLPQPIQDAIASGEPDQVNSAIGKIVNDLGTIVHNAVLAQVRGEMRQAFANLASLADQTSSDQSRKSATDAARQAYYDAFPAHNNPLILPIIQAETQKMAAEFPHLRWDENYMNALGARVNSALEQLGVKPPEPTPEPTPTPTPTPKPAGFVGGGAPRPAPVTPTGELGEDIIDVFS